jgi:hypothetical protein
MRSFLRVHATRPTITITMMIWCDVMWCDVFFKGEHLWFVCVLGPHPIFDDLIWCDVLMTWLMAEKDCSCCPRFCFLFWCSSRSFQVYRSLFLFGLAFGLVDNVHGYASSGVDVSLLCLRSYRGSFKKSSGITTPLLFWVSRKSLQASAHTHVPVPWWSMIHDWFLSKLPDFAPSFLARSHVIAPTPPCFLSLPSQQPPPSPTRSRPRRCMSLRRWKCAAPFSLSPSPPWWITAQLPQDFPWTRIMLRCLEVVSLLSLY